MSVSTKETDSTESLNVFNRKYTMRRYPTQHSKELRAWDSADLYLLNTTLEELKPFEGTRIEEQAHSICILNDTFGALTIPLLDHTAHQVLIYGDSWMSRQALETNHELNGISKNYRFEESLESLIEDHSAPSLVIGRVPKSSAHLSYILNRLNSWLAPDTLLLLGGMDKHLSRGQFELLEKHFGPSKFMPGVKKARIWRSLCDKSLKSTQHVTSSRVIELPTHKLRLTALPNVFSHDKLDMGSRFLIDRLAMIPQAHHVADMACGYGILGLAYLHRYPKARLIFCDESFQAVESTRANLDMNHPDADAVAYADDGLKRVESASLDLVLCNPPFHQQHTVSTDIARSLFRDAHRALVRGGELWVIANQHLGYHIDLSRLFSRCETVASDKKFVLLRATR